MDWYKKPSSRYRDSELRTILGRKLFESGTHVLNTLEEMVADTFSIGKWVDDIKKSLLIGKPHIPPFIREVDYEMFNGFLFLRDEERLNMAYDSLMILKEHGYLEYDQQSQIIVIGFPKILQSLGRFQTDCLGDAIKKKELPWDIVSPFLSEEQVAHFVKKYPKICKLALIPKKELPRQIQPTRVDDNQDSDENKFKEQSDKTLDRVLEDKENDLYSELNKSTGELKYYQGHQEIDKKTFTSYIVPF